MKNPVVYRLPLPWERLNSALDKYQAQQRRDLWNLAIFLWIMVLYLGFQALRAFPVYQLWGVFQ